ncbi:MAG: ABC transporter permease [Gemmatimonadaceae bacterium]
MDSLRDLRLGLRTLRKSPGLTVIATIALTFGIGLTTMIFSIIYGAMIKGLPYEDGDRIVVIERTNAERGIEEDGLPIADYADFAAQQQSHSQVGGFTSGTMNVSGTERAERYSGTWVTSQVLTMTGVRPVLGRDFLPGEDSPSGARVAILGYDMWQTRFGGDAGVLGTSIRVNGTPYEVVGVMPSGFRWPQNGQLWLPMQNDPLAGKRDEGQQLQVVAKLKPGVTHAQAAAEATTILQRLGEQYPETNKGFVGTATDFVEDAIGPEPRQLLFAMLGAVFFVLLIACANVANLLLDRAVHRTKEVGVRSALGASRGAIVRIFLSEALVLAIAGTVLGIALAYAGTTAFTRSIADTDPPFFIQIGLYPPVLLFAVTMAVVATLFSGLIPAIQSSRPDIAEVLKDESRGASSLKIGRISKALIVFEVALSCGLLVAAGLTIKSVTKARNLDTGFAMASVYTTRVGFPSAYTDTVKQRLFFAQLAERVAALPGVQGAAIASGLPGAEQGLWGSRFSMEGVAYAKEQERPRTRWAAVTPGLFQTLEIPLRRGRLFDETDRRGGLDVAVVTERFAEEHMKGEDPIGRRIRIGLDDENAPWVTIVGVIPNLFGGDPEDPYPSVVLRPFEQQHASFAYIAVRSAVDPMAFADPVREVVASLDPDIPTYWPMTLDVAVSRGLWFVRVFGTMFMGFGLVALFLASIGLYAVMSFSVGRRTREVGIRMALGATAHDVLRLMMSQGFAQLGIGLAIGLVLAGLISRVLTLILFDVKPLDPVVFGAVAVTLMLSGTVACLVPARRATRIDPSEAMRAE